MTIRDTNDWRIVKYNVYARGDTYIHPSTSKVYILFSVLFYACECLASVYIVYHMHTLHPQRSEEGVRSPDLELQITPGKPLDVCWEINVGPLKEQSEHLTTKPSL